MCGLWIGWLFVQWALDWLVICTVSSGLAGYLYSGLMGKLFTLSWNWLALEVAGSSPSARLQMLKHQNEENRRHG
jgi:hypothetical protein